MIELAENEHIVATFRKHWFPPLVHSITTALLLIVPVLLFLFVINHTFTTSFGEFHFSFNNPPVIALLTGIWGLILWISFFTFWTDYHLDGWIITNKRVIDINQCGFFRRDISNFRLERLQDVKAEVRGVIATFLKFGNVRLQTAGTDKEFLLRNASSPEHIKEVILEQYDEAVGTDVSRTGRDGVAQPK